MCSLTFQIRKWVTPHFLNNIYWKDDPCMPMSPSASDAFFALALRGGHFANEWQQYIDIISARCPQFLQHLAGTLSTLIIPRYSECTFTSRERLQRFLLSSSIHLLFHFELSSWTLTCKWLISWKLESYYFILAASDACYYCVSVTFGDWPNRWMTQTAWDFISHLDACDLVNLMMHHKRTGRLTLFKLVSLMEIYQVLHEFFCYWLTYPSSIILIKFHEAMHSRHQTINPDTYGAFHLEFCYFYIIFLRDHSLQLWTFFSVNATDRNLLQLSCSAGTPVSS